ncbi:MULTISPECIES: cbb3-type cytochrome c oxidase N-terminal domain-containing protein [Hymenobacter]|uniref:C-type cytochrome n=1 Tax=Hymenobacter jejuensis TaxID=2502781 RepID=A0A5B8A179_9BACT|nr:MULTISPECIES: cbb3-type cytochrome c oxidase N-terminal domain-containing protein [Hymenobacter]MBC6990533.1 c-type cytochrome [Hymenobacter sp. BT491]QDA61048.1 c-type cytochrome [Hymenobacter jejuensis]
MATTLKNRSWRLSAAALLLSFSAQAQAPEAAATPAGMSGQEMLFWVLVSLLGVLVLALVLTGILIVVQLRPQLRKVYEMPTVRPSWSGKVLGLFVGDPVLLQGRVRDEIMSGHDYDGIHEFDNDLPPWWKMGFYGTIAFAAVYLFYFHVADAGQLSQAEYETEMKQAALLVSVGSDDPNKLTDFQPLTAAADIGAGKSLFATNCAPCHGAAAEGKVGPNLTDEYWLHGGEVNHVYKTVKFGVQGKGMVAWKGKLSSKQILQVSSYILTLQGSKPANAKEPQGEKDPTATKIAMR